MDSPCSLVYLKYSKTKKGTTYDAATNTTRQPALSPKAKPMVLFVVLKILLCEINEFMILLTKRPSLQQKHNGY